MRTKEEVQGRLDELKSVSPSGGLTLFKTTETALNAYFERGDLSGTAYDTLKRVVFDGLMSGLEVERPELLPAISKAYPKGYADVRELLDGGGVLEEIMTIDAETFRRAFTSEVTGTTGTSVIWHNQYLETKWANGLKSAKGELGSGLEAVEAFCRGRYESWTLALIFEELGRRHQHWSEDRREFAKNIYVERGWGEFIEALGLGLYEPSYLGELR